MKNDKMEKRPFKKRKAAFDKKKAAQKTSEPKLSREERQILSALKKHGETPIPARSLLRESGMKNKILFYELLRKLHNMNQIEVDKKHKVRYTPYGKGVRAQLVSLSGKFGFARPDDGGADVFIPGSALNGAFPGDKVVLTDVAMQERGPDGKIKHIVEHNENPITGTLKVTENGTFVTPDAALRYDLEVIGGTMKAKPGDKVVFTPQQNYRGDWTGAKISAVLGSGDIARICADAIIVEKGIPNVFPPEVLEEAKQAAARKITSSDIEERLDLRGELIFTIDGADAKDLDDAISVKKNSQGYELGVHIADVSHYIQEHTRLDEEAFNRGTSVYFADRVIPMLPVAISNGICSLNAGEDKLTFSALLTFDGEGELVDYDFKKTIIESKVRGVYSEVNEIFAGTASAELLEKYKPVESSLQAARELSAILTENEKRRGTMEIVSGEIKFVLDDKGVCVDILPRTTGEAEHLIEQLMVSANMAAAKFSQKHDLPFLYRIHERPQTEKLESLIEVLDRLMVPCAELKSRKPSTGDFAKVLERVKGSTKEEVVSQRVLRTMEKAKYAAEELGHFGLALEDYSHFTSPIRRYPDLAIHRIMSAYLSGMPIKKIKKRYGSFAEEAAAQSTKNEIRAVSGERDAEDCYVAEYMKAHIGEKHVGIISGATARGIFVRLKNGAEGFVSMENVPGDFEFDGMISHVNRTTNQSLTVGDEFAIIVASSDVASGRVDFIPDQE